MSTRVIAAVLFVSIASSVVVAQTGKIEPIGPVTNSDVPAAVKKVLETKGYRVSLDDGSVACEIWLRNKIPAQPKKEWFAEEVPVDDELLRAPDPGRELSVRFLMVAFPRHGVPLSREQAPQWSVSTSKTVGASQRTPFLPTFHHLLKLQ